MSRVRVLPEVLSHQIAAGEIIERPASVVKELVENALDAEATRISIIVEDGGRKLISVRDDGYGMTGEDARLAFEHHATSKIRGIDDLTRIGTLGFRGEALPSISSVSRVRMRTVSHEDGPETAPGTEIEYHGGKLQEVREVAWPRGTEVRVEDLFYNVPARRKFMKTASTELSHISRQVSYYALGYPDVEFQLRHGKRQLIDAATVNSFQDRAFQLMGEEFIRNLVPLDFTRDGVKISGFTSLPHEQRSNAHSMFLYVNRRMVRDRVLSHAIRLAYRDLIPSSCYPVILLFVEVDPEEIDVNVHPAKTEIRFRDSQRVHLAITRGIEEALLLNKSNLSSLAHDLYSEATTQHSERVNRSLERYFNRQPAGSGGLQNGFRNYPHFSSAGASSMSEQESLRDRTADWNFGPSGDDPHAHLIPETTSISNTPRVLGQFVESFIVAVDREGVMVIDQHVAHERILYDRALRELDSSDGLPTQRLLVPVTLELNPQQKALAGTIVEHLNENGFEVEWFGSNALLIRGVPSLAREADIRRTVEDLFNDLDALDERDDAYRQEGACLKRIREQIAISLSCRAAIKINHPLTAEKMEWLLDELFRCENPYTCPHGRPIVLRLNIEQILKGFKRI